MSEPVFSIVIACYNHERFIREALESALRQEHPSKEIIVVDDASTDASAEVLRSFGRSIIFEQLPVNRGAGAARNFGASVAKGKYLVFLDGDDALAPWSLRVYGRMIGERRPTIILGRSNLFYGDLPTIATTPPSNIQLVEYATFLDKDRPWIYNSSSLVVERSTFWAVGGWSPAIFQQDIQDLLNKLCLAGKTIMAVAPETVFYRMHSTNAVRQVAPFIEGIYVLLEKAKRGAYPGGTKVSTKRAAWFGGLIFYWAREGIRNGYFCDGLKLALNGWRMVLLAAVRRAAVLMVGRRPVEVLSVEPRGAESLLGPHPACFSKAGALSYGEKRPKAKASGQIAVGRR
jgi:GT2 family glycosyltransferase